MSSQTAIYHDDNKFMQNRYSEQVILKVLPLIIIMITIIILSQSTTTTIVISIMDLRDTL